MVIRAREALIDGDIELLTEILWMMEEILSERKERTNTRDTKRHTSP